MPPTFGDDDKRPFGIRRRADAFLRSPEPVNIRRLGTGEIAGPGAYVYEPAVNMDSWSCEGDEPVIVQITMSGSLTYLGEDGRVIASTDTDNLRESYLAWCAEEGLEPVALGA